MPNPKNLPHLLKLLDDDSPVVQENVLKELSSFGPSLKRELAKLNIPVSDDLQQKMTNLLEEYNGRWLREAWHSWFDLENDKEKLEIAMGLLAEYQYGRGYPVQLKTLLDELAEEFRETAKKQDALTLAHFLFKVRRLKGADADYYNPINSNLIYVIEEKRGIPISLACVYILVGKRLQYDVEGINFPGHFLARAVTSKRSFIVDCYNGGRCLGEQEAVSWNNGPPVPIKDLLPLECDAHTIIARVLRNLINAYQQEGNVNNVELMTELLEMMENEGEEGDESEEE
ncbi:MAG: transglutaminase-like domain-containing protein [Ignavibacteriae bacterium]|nr:transglutaminase-like domain-containing protein [Ignavibacteriota bacterium]